MALHIITPFSRPENLQFYLENLKDKNIIWHPLLNEVIDFTNEPWILPYMMVNSPMRHLETPAPYTADGWHYNIAKLNDFINNVYIEPNDRYLFMNDDDWFENNVFEQFKEENDPEDDVCFISMKRGVGDLGTFKGTHGTFTLMVDLNRVIPGNIGFEQMCLKGRVLRTLKFENSDHFDGLMAIHLHNQYKVLPLYEVYALFNFLENERWGR